MKSCLNQFSVEHYFPFKLPKSVRLLYVTTFPFLFSLISLLLPFVCPCGFSDQ